MRGNDPRRHPRVDVELTAVVDGDEAHACTVEDLSIGGALLRRGPVVSVGKVIRLTLHLADDNRLAIEALVVREAPEQGFGSAFAIAFRNLTAQDEDVLQDVILSAVELLNAPGSESRQRSVGPRPAERSSSLQPETTRRRSSSWPRK